MGTFTDIPAYPSNRFAILLLVASCLIGVPGSAAWAAGGGADSSIVNSYRWETWQRGADAGVRAFGRFGRGDTIDTPPGDLMIQLGYHIWYEHIAEVHATLGLGMTNGTFLYGVGTRINLLELIDDAYGEFRERGLQRGLLSPFLKNLMLFASVELDHIHFKDPDPTLGLTYNNTSWRYPFGLGAQWYINMHDSSFSRRLYIETSFEYMQVSSSNYFMPYLGLGVELR